MQRGTMTETQRERDRREQDRGGEEDRKKQAGAERTRYEREKEKEHTRENQTKRDRERKRPRQRERQGDREQHSENNIAHQIRLTIRHEKDGQRLRETRRDKEMGVGAVAGHKAERDGEMRKVTEPAGRRSQTHVQIQKETQNRSETQTAPGEMGRRQRQAREGGPKSLGAPSLCLPTRSRSSSPAPGQAAALPRARPPHRYLWDAASPRPAAT